MLPNKLTIPSDIPLLVQQTYDETNNEMLGELTEGMKRRKKRTSSEQVKKEQRRKLPDFEAVK